MKTKEEILEGRELQIEDFAGRGNHLTVFSKGTVLDAMEDYTKQEAIAFLFFVLNEDFYRIDTMKWKHLSRDTIYTNEELYSLYLQSKEKNLNK